MNKKYGDNSGGRRKPIARTFARVGSRRPGNKDQRGHQFTIKKDLSKDRKDRNQDQKGDQQGQEKTLHTGDRKTCATDKPLALRAALSFQFISSGKKAMKARSEFPGGPLVFLFVVFHYLVKRRSDGEWCLRKLSTGRAADARDEFSFHLSA